MPVRIDPFYDGGGYHGWARQPGLRTVQGEVEQALDTVLRGRRLVADRRRWHRHRVHARAQVAHG